MEEDVAGTQAAGTLHTYVTCAECGRVFLRESMVAVPASLNDASHSECEELCPDCRREDEKEGPPLFPKVGDSDRVP
jgi:hypothetical protein